MSESWNTIDLTELSGLSSEFTLEKVKYKLILRGLIRNSEL